jgi:PAS domain S-box-containing protein
MKESSRKLPPAADAIVALLWESSDFVVITRLSDGALIYANDATVALAGIPRERFIGRTSLEIGLWDDPGDRAAFLHTLFEQGRIEGVPVSTRASTGEVLVTHVSAMLATVEGEAVIVSIARDATEACRTEQLLAIEHAVTRLLVGALSLPETAPKVLALLGERIDWELGLWWAVDPAAGVLRHLASWRSPLAEPSAVIRLAPQTHFRIGHGLPGMVWERGAPMWIPEVEPDGRAAAERDEELHSAVLFPLLAGGEIFGVVEFLSQKRRRVDDALLETLEALGGQLGQFARSR